MRDRPQGPEQEPEQGYEPEPGDADFDAPNEPEPDWAEAIRRDRRERAERVREQLEALENEPEDTPG